MQAERAFAERGLHSTSLTTDILDPADVSVGSLYRQFSNKRDRLIAVFGECESPRPSIASLMSAPERSSFADVLQVCLCTLLDDLDRREDAWWLQYRERLSPDRSIRDVVEAGWRAWAMVVCVALSRWYAGSEQQIALATRIVAHALPPCSRTI